MGGTSTKYPFGQNDDPNNAINLQGPPAPAVPTPDNSQSELEAAAARQRKAKGAAATIISNQRRSGLASMDLSSGGTTSSRLLLGS